LHDVRAYILKREPGDYDRHWHRATELLLEASKGGDIEVATKQLELAMFLEGRLRI
jgi:hypothetical protein